MPPSFLFAPGAGAPSSHPWMQEWKKCLQSLGEVVTFDYDYMREGRKRPDPLPTLIAAHRAALLALRQKSKGSLFLVGKSMGGRIGCHVALEERVSGVICFGYPLCGGGDPAKLRDKVLRELRTPILFVQGTRDSLCPIDLLEQVRVGMDAENRLHLVEGGDHSLRVPKRGYPEQSIVDERIRSAISAFVLSFGGEC